jgi:chorismate mutase/prephenate dehydratase
MKGNVNRMVRDMNNLEQIDSEILALLKKREQIAVSGDQFLSCDIESLLSSAQANELNPSFVKQLFRLINRETGLVYTQKLIAEKNPKWNNFKSASFLGPVGTYSYQALKKYCDSHNLHLDEISCGNFRDQINNVRQGISDLAFLPIENTSSGIINDVIDLLNDHNVYVIGEVVLHIVHSILVNRPETAGRIKYIYSHPQPIVQCSNFLSVHYPDVSFKYCDSTADAIKKVKEMNSDEAAAIGSDMGGSIFGLKPLISNIANQTCNYTRFIVIAKDPVKFPREMTTKTSISFTTDNKPGALSDILDIFRKYNYNMTKLTSRPIIGRPWEEQFYADFIANIESADAQKALDEISMNCRSLHILGCYPMDSE